MSSEQGEYYDLGGFHRAVTTASAEAQTWFDRGLIWSFAFNHEESAKCFEKAISYDPDCALAYWGLAYALGPNYNKPWELFGKEERKATVERTHHAVKEARRRASGASPVEQALIRALRHRYQDAQTPSKKKCAIWNREYADSMSKVAAKFPEDPDVAALYADSMMNLTPWALWDLETGKPAKGARTVEIQRVLEGALESPAGRDHAGVLHLYIHLMEMSSTPEKAMPAANRLRDLVPDAGHLNHMPSHIDILVGDYLNGVKANTKAVKADEKYLAENGPLNFYTLYRCHDYHFGLYSAMFAAQFKVAMGFVSQLESTITDELLRIENPPMADWLESFLAMRVHALIRFGRWKDITVLAVPNDKEIYCVSTAMIYYAKGVAFAALGKVGEAKMYRALFQEAVPRVKPTRTLFNNRCVDILGVASSMLDGEIAYREADFDTAFIHLRESIAKYDSLPYDEPWGWMQPTRHAYGALLLEQGRVGEALAVYSADLGVSEELPRTHRHPNNVWALVGYHECLVKLGRVDEAKEVEPRLKKALDQADVPITSSCFCRTECPKTGTSKI